MITKADVLIMKPVSDVSDTDQEMMASATAEASPFSSGSVVSQRCTTL